MIGDPCYSIQLSDDCMRLFKKNKERFREKLAGEMTARSGTLQEMLEPFCTEFREEFVEDSTHVESCNIEIDGKGEGDVYINFDGYVHYGCRDMCRTIDHCDCIRFKIDLETGSLTFYIDYPPEREPDEI